MVSIVDAQILMNRISKQGLIKLGELIGVQCPPNVAKSEMITIIRENHPNGFTLDQYGLIEISYVYSKMQRQKWLVYRLGESTSLDAPSIVPRTITSSLYKELDALMLCHIYSCVHNGFLWIRIKPSELGTDASRFSDEWSSSIFVTHVIGSNYVLMSPVAQKYSQLLVVAVAAALKRSHMELLELSGSNMDSLTELLFNMYSYGGFSDYRLQLKDNNPLDVRPIQKTTPRVVATLPENVVMEQSHEWWSHHQSSEQSWGTHDPPSLQSIVVNCTTHFLYHNNPIAYDVSMNIEFKGSNILKGFKELEQSGYALLPQPIVEFGKNPRNVVSITEFSDEDDS